MSIGVPIKLLHEAQGHIVTLELTNNLTYRGKLNDIEDNMNIQLKEVLVTQRDGQTLHLDQIYVRGSSIRFVVVPDMLKNAPMFKRVGNKNNKGFGIGKGNMGRGGRTQTMPNQGPPRN